MAKRNLDWTLEKYNSIFGFETGIIHHGYIAYL
jgi:hypothetical protein